MRYIAEKLNDDYEITHIKEMATIDGAKVEIVMGKTNANKDKLENTIKELKEEKKQRIEQMDNDIIELEDILKSIISIQ